MYGIAGHQAHLEAPYEKFHSDADDADAFLNAEIDRIGDELAIFCDAELPTNLHAHLIGPTDADREVLAAVSALAILLANRRAAHSDLVDAWLRDRRDEARYHDQQDRAERDLWAD